MATTIFFLILDGVGVVFFLYVLANFWKEGHRPIQHARKYATEFGERDWANGSVIPHPNSTNAQGGPLRDSVSSARAIQRHTGSQDGFL